MKTFARSTMIATAVGLALAVLTGCDLFGADPLGTVTGQVVDVTTGLGVSGVSVRVRDASEYTTTTATNGSFTFDIPVGTQTLTFTIAGFVIPDYQVNVIEDRLTSVPESAIIANPALSPDEIRIVLTWGADPRDLDSHLMTPSGHHIYYASRNPVGAGANLDYDDTTGYGPETITITEMQEGRYRYFVHRFSGQGTLAGSGAQVRVFDDSGLIGTYTAPSTGVGDYWNVFTMDNLVITVVDQIQETQPVR